MSLPRLILPAFGSALTLIGVLIYFASLEI